MSFRLEDFSPERQAEIRRKLGEQPVQPLQITGGASVKAENLKLVEPKPEGEEDIQRAAIKLLQDHGYLVLQTAHRYQSQACPECGTWLTPCGGYGSTPGVPDLICSRPEWPRGVWLGIEMKTAKGPLSAAQELLKAQGRIVIARSAGVAIWEANATSEDFASSLMAPAYIDPAEVQVARAKVQKEKEAKQLAAARKKRGTR